MDSISFHGAGLRSGKSCAVSMTRSPGPLELHDASGREITRPWRHRVVASRLAVALPNGRHLEGVEHLFGALGGLGIHHGIRIAFSGTELPLLDGAAFELALALRALAPPRARPKVRVAQAGEVLAGTSRYSFEPRPGIEVGVEIKVRGRRQRVFWSGNARDFVDRIAPARLCDAANRSLWTVLQGACYVDPAVIALIRDDGAVEAPGRPLEDAEVAHHHLLDLLADLYLFGGPPLGRVVAFAPEHAANHYALEHALDFGLIQQVT